MYPLPGHVSLGVHAVIGLEGRLRFGPDAEYLPDRVQDYRVDEGKRAAFGEAIRRLVPAIRDEDIDPDMSGIRPKLQGPGQGFRDFVIAEESARGLPGPREPDRHRLPRPDLGPVHRRRGGTAHRLSRRVSAGPRPSIRGPAGSRAS